MKNKLRSYSFWMSVAAGVILVLNNLGNYLGFYVESEEMLAIVDSICGVLILFGVLTMPKKSETEENEKAANSEVASEEVTTEGEHSSKESMVKCEDVSAEQEINTVLKKTENDIKDKLSKESIEKIIHHQDEIK